MPGNLEPFQAQDRASPFSQAHPNALAAARSQMETRDAEVQVDLLPVVAGSPPQAPEAPPQAPEAAVPADEAAASQLPAAGESEEAAAAASPAPPAPTPAAQAASRQRVVRTSSTSGGGSKPPLDASMYVLHSRHSEDRCAWAWEWTWAKMPHRTFNCATGRHSCGIQVTAHITAVVLLYTRV